MPYAYGSAANAVDVASAAGNQKIGGVNTPGELVAKFHLGGLILVSFAADDPTGATNPATNMQDPAQVRAGGLPEPVEPQDGEALDVSAAPLASLVQR